MAKKKRQALATGGKPAGAGESRDPRLFPEKKPAAAPRQAAEPAVDGGGGVKSRVLWISALLLIVSGYVLLRKADPGGQNAWAAAAPALLLSGYLLIIPSIFSSFRGKD